MLTINLLPAQGKKIIMREMRRRLIRFFCCGAAIILGVGEVLMLPSYLPLLLRQQELKRAVTVEKEASQRLSLPAVARKEEMIRATTDAIRLFDHESQKASRLMMPFLNEATITITGVTVRNNGDVFLNGRAATRRNLLAFEKTLRESGRFQEISFPLSNIVRETNINFTVQGVLKPQYRL